MANLLRAASGGLEIGPVGATLPVGYPAFPKRRGFVAQRVFDCIPILGRISGCLLRVPDRVPGLVHLKRDGFSPFPSLVSLIQGLRRAVMECFRSRLLDPEGQVRFESLDVCLETRTAPDGTEVWSGYFEPPSVSGVISGGVFRLVLDDGRAQDVEVQYVEAVVPEVHVADPVHRSGRLTLAGRHEQSVRADGGRRQPTCRRLKDSHADITSLSCPIPVHTVRVPICRCGARVPPRSPA